MLLVEHYIHINDGRVPLSLAQKATDELLATQEWDEDAPIPEPGEEPGAAENDAALADLMSRMGGLNLG